MFPENTLMLKLLYFFTCKKNNIKLKVSEENISDNFEVLDYSLYSYHAQAHNNHGMQIGKSLEGASALNNPLMTP